jgi:molybdate/tungstate transport system substrate-binding protein
VFFNGAEMKWRFFNIIIFFIFSIILNSCSKRESLIIFHAGSLSKPMVDLTKAFQMKYPNIQIIREASGSREAARKISELDRRADLVAVADYLVVEEMLIPEDIDWYVNFATNRMVIAFTEKSRYSSEISSENWFKILAREDVRFGRSDENLDPCGYRTLMVWKLADMYYNEKINGQSIYDVLYKQCPKNNIRPGSVKLLPLLESMSLDYAFEYVSVALQHRLRYIDLPEEIDLSNSELEPIYRNVGVAVTGKSRGESLTIYGTSIVYSIAVLKDAQNQKRAIEFIRFLLSAEGNEIIKKNGQEPIIPTSFSDNKKIQTLLR